MKNLLSSHMCDGLNDQLDIEVCGEPSDIGEHQEYKVRGFNQKAGNTETLCEVRFQEGGYKTVGVNGLSNEALLAIIEHRLRGFQSGPFSCRENSVALTKVQEAILWLKVKIRGGIGE